MYFIFKLDYNVDKIPEGLSRKSIGGCYGVLLCEIGLYPNHTLKLSDGLVCWVP